MEIIKLLLPLLGVFLGALITGIGLIWKARVERKRLIACALADLLEVRHHLLAFRVVIHEVKKKFDVPAELAPILRTVMQRTSPLDPETHTRYSTAVSVLAGIDPVLAFKMRSKDRIPQMFETMNELLTSSGIAPTALEGLIASLHDLVIPSLDEAVVELAGQHSLFTKRKVQQIVAKADEPPRELIALLDRAKSANEKISS